MYKFAYLYVRLGYILAGVVFGVSVMYFGGTLLILEFQKPRESSREFNRELADIQGKIKAQVDNIRIAFNIDPQTPALNQLSTRSWETSYISPASAEHLFSEREAALHECEELSSVILAKLEADIGFILEKLDASPVANTRAADRGADSNTAPAQPTADQTQIPLYVKGPWLEAKISECLSAKRVVESILGETKNSENRSALERAQAEINRFLGILTGEQNKTSREPDPSGPNATRPSSPAAPAIEPGRKENVRAELLSVLSEVKNAVTGDWTLSLTLQNTLGEELDKFRDRAVANNMQANALLRSQLVSLGLLLLSVVLAFFIAVGSDLVRAILDSAVWLSHICVNTSAASGTDEPQQDQ